jgi:hypothetical protein
MNGMTMVVGAIERAGQTNFADVLSAFGSICRRDLILREDGSVWALRNAGTTINAGIRVDVDPGPFIDRLTGDHTFHGANIDTPAITNAQTGNNVSHGSYSFGECDSRM